MWIDFDQESACAIRISKVTRQYAHTIPRWSMYRHILISTDGSELAGRAVTNGLSLAKSLGAKVTVMIVEEPFNWLNVSVEKAQRSFAEHGAFEELAKHTAQIK